MSNNNNLTGNISTIIKYILITFSGYIISASAAHGINLPITETQLTELLGIILFFIIAHIDAKYPNNIFHDIVEFQQLKTVDNEEIIEEDGKIIIKSSPETENIEEDEEVEGDDTQY